MIKVKRRISEEDEIGVNNSLYWDGRVDRIRSPLPNGAYLGIDSAMSESSFL
jgi:hypothetical protein